MTLNTVATLDVITSHALSTGLFDRVNTHEPKNAPGSGLSGAVWADRILPVPTGSGLASTSALMIVKFRIYTSMISEPQDSIDPMMIDAVDALMTAYSGDYELGGNVRCVDLLGMAGVTLSATAGYLDISGKIYRVITIDIPLIINDAWSQSP